MESNKFYVYVYLDPRKEGNYVYGDLSFTHEPFYVGKGTGYRCNNGIKDDNRNLAKLKHNKIKGIVKDNCVPIVIKISDNLSEKDSFIIETETIKLIGKIIDNIGPLTNITDGGEGMRGYKHTEEWKMKLSKIIIQYTINNEFVSEFTSIKSACENTGICKQNIGACANGKYKTAGGFIWKYKDEKDKLQSHLKHPAIMPKHSEETKNKLKNKRRTKNTIDKLKKVQAIPVLQYDLNENFIKEWYSLSEAARFYNTSIANICNCCKGNRRHSIGYIWKYKN